MQEVEREGPALEYVFVAFRSTDAGKSWCPVERDNLPDWLRDAHTIERMLTGVCARNPAEEAKGGPEVWWKLTQLDRPRLAGRHAAMRRSRKTGIVLPASYH